MARVRSVFDSAGHDAHVLCVLEVLLCSDDSLGVYFRFVPSKYPCHAEVRYLRVHVHVEKNVASFQIPVDDPQSGILMEVQKASSNPNYDAVTRWPVQQPTLGFI